MNWKKNIKKNWPFVFVLLLAIVIVAGFMYYHQFINQEQNSLAIYSPADTNFFLEVNLKNKNLEKFKQNNFRGYSRLTGALKKAELTTPFNSYFLNEVDVLAVGETEKKEKFWLAKAKNVPKLQTLMPRGYYVQHIKSQVLGITKSQRLIFHTPKKGALQKKYKFFLNENIVNIYLSDNYLTQIKNKPDLGYQLILNNIKLKKEKGLFVLLKLNKDNNISFEFLQEKTNSQGKKVATDEVVKKTLGNNYLWVAVSPGLENQLDLFWKQFLPTEEKNNPQLAEIKNDIKNSINDQVLIILDSNKTTISNNDFFKLQNKKTMLGFKGIKNPENFTQLWSKLLAYKFPSKEKVFLPDKSSYEELVADAEKIEFKELEDGLKYFNQENFFFGIKNWDDYIFVSNNKDLIQNLGAEKNFTPLDECLKNKSNEIHSINGNKLESGTISYGDQIIINLKGDSKSQVAEGCFLWNK